MIHLKYYNYVNNFIISGWFNDPKTMVKLIHANEMTKRREMLIKKQMPNYKFVSIQECQFDKYYKDSSNNQLLQEVEQEIATTFIQPRSFYFGG